MVDRYLAGSSSESTTRPRLITGSKQVVTAPVTVASGGGVIAAYTLLGIVTGTGKAVVSTSGAGDGSEIPRYILPHEIDTTAADVDMSCYAEGCFNPDMVQFGTGHTAESVAEGLRDRGIYLQAPL